MGQQRRESRGLSQSQTAQVASRKSQIAIAEGRETKQSQRNDSPKTNEGKEKVRTSASEEERRRTSGGSDDRNGLENPAVHECRRSTQAIVVNNEREMASDRV